jgi:D-tyrosyl-tRNA(Tyr) deacylase
MRVVIQRSKESYVKVDDKIVGKIDNGLVVLVGFTNRDNSNDIDYIIKKILSLRIFDDNNGVMNLSVKDINGSILSISQFTLYADTKGGNRPSYINSLNKDEAIILYEEFNKKLKEQINLETGIFKADMKVTINNDGPVTIIIDSKDK